MASIVNRPNGHKWIQFRKDGKRYTVRLGKASKFAADNMKHHIEQIQQAGEAAEEVPTKTAAYLRELAPTWHDRLCRTGLLDGHSAPLSRLLDEAARYYSTKSPNTQHNMKQVSRRLVDFFGSDRRLESIISEECEEFRRHLEHVLNLAPCTTDESCRKAKVLFNRAIRAGWLEKNPFDTLKHWRLTNRDNLFFVDRQTFFKAIENRTPTTRAVLALGRLGGLRLPSEAHALRWRDVDFKKGRLSVYSPKFRHLGDRKAWRVCPLFEDLRPFLEALPRDGDQVINGLKADRAALFTRAKKAVLANGLEPWPRLLHNLRASRATELVEEGYPKHVINSWLGHCETISEAHYMMTLTSHFDRATGLNEGRSNSRSVAPVPTLQPTAAC